MDKKTAIQLLGGSIRSASEAIGVTYKAVHKWPDQLTPRLVDRVLAAQLRAGIASIATKKSSSR